MKDFKTFLREQTTEYSAFALPRTQMPQINNMDHFINFIERLKISYSKTHGYVDHLKPTQYGYDEVKVAKLASELTNSSKPIVVSSDGFILDGHHRYFAAISDDGMKLNQIIVELPLNKLLKLAMDYIETYG